jgi:hypothetical protein
VLAFNDIFDGAEPILPAASRSRRIDWCHVKLNPGGGEIDANPVDEPAALLGDREPVTTVRNACEDLEWPVRMTLLPKSRGGKDDKRPQTGVPVFVVMTNSENPVQS